MPPAHQNTRFAHTLHTRTGAPLLRRLRANTVLKHSLKQFSFRSRIGYTTPLHEMPLIQGIPLKPPVGTGGLVQLVGNTGG